MADKIYCSKCKHYTGTMTRGKGKDNFCYAEGNTKAKETWLCLDLVLDKKPSVINKNNDCPWFSKIK